MAGSVLHGEMLYRPVKGATSAKRRVVEKLETQVNRSHWTEMKGSLTGADP